MPGSLAVLNPQLHKAQPSHSLDKQKHTWESSIPQVRPIHQ